MKARTEITIGDQKVLTAHRELMDFCQLCYRNILKNQYYVRKENVVYHYNCIKSRPITGNAVRI